MAYGEVAYLSHKDNNDVTWRIGIRKLDYVGTSTQLNAQAPVFELNYQTNTQNIFEPLISSSVRVFLDISGTAQKNLINDIRVASDTEYQIRLDKAGDLYWVGTVLPDLTTEQVGGEPFAVTVEAVDGSSLWQYSQYDVNAGSGQRGLAYYIAETIGRFRHNVVWSPVGVSGDTLLNSAPNNAPLIDYEDTQRVRYTHDYFLKQVARRFGGRWMYADGRWHLQQIEGAEQDADYSEIEPITEANKIANNYTHSVTEDITISNVATTSNDFQSGLNISQIPAIGSSSVTFDHRNGIAPLDDGADLAFNQNGYSKTYFYSPNGDETLKFSGVVAVRTMAGYDPNDNNYVNFTFRTDDHYYDVVSKQWRSGNQTNRLRVDRSGGAFFSIETAELPADMTRFFIEISAVKRDVRTNPFKAGATATSNNLRYEWEIEDGSDAASAALTTTATTENGASLNYDVGGLRYGDEPAPGALPYFVDLSRNVLDDGWTSPNVTTAENIDRLLTRTINRFYKVAKKRLRGMLMKGYSPNQTITFDGTTYIFDGGTLNGTGYWQGTWSELSYDDESVAFTRTVQSASQNIPSGTAGILNDVLALSFRERNRLEADQLTVTTAGIDSGDVFTSISMVSPSEELEGVLRTGDIVQLYNPVTANIQQFTLTSDFTAGDTTLPIESATAAFDFPIGSSVILTGEALRSYILKTNDTIVLGVGTANKATTADDEQLQSSDDEDYYFVDNDPDARINESFSQIRLLQDEIVLKVDANGRLSLVKLEASPEEGSRLTLQADNIDISGVATFLTNNSSFITSVANEAGDIEVTGVNVYESASEPTGGSYNLGDIWLDTDNGNAPYVYNGSSWVAEFTQIDGGRLTTGSVVADSLASNSVTADKITANAVTTDKISANAINADKIAADAITTDKIRANEIESDRLQISVRGGISPAFQALASDDDSFIVGADDDDLVFSDVSDYDQQYIENKVRLTVAESRIDVNTTDITLTSSRVSGTETSIAAIQTDVSQQGVSITTLSNTLTTNGISSSTNIKSEVDALKSNIVLTTNSNGNIARLDLSSGAEGSEININADKITFTGSTTFRDDLFAAEITVGDKIKSSNFGSSTGFQINSNGKITANEIDLRGNIFASVIKEQIIIDTDGIIKTSVGALDFDNASIIAKVSGTLTGQITAVTTTSLQRALTAGEQIAISSVLQRNFKLTVSSNVSAGATSIPVNAITLPQQINNGSNIYIASEVDEGTVINQDGVYIGDQFQTIDNANLRIDKTKGITLRTPTVQETAQNGFKTNAISWEFGNTESADIYALNQGIDNHRLYIKADKIQFVQTSKEQVAAGSLTSLANALQSIGLIEVV